MSPPLNTDPLFGVHLKLDRADAHVAALDAEVSAWLAREPYTLYGEFESWPKFGKGESFGLYHLKFRDVGAIPSEWSVVVGDFLHNARTALDHLVWQLVLANDATPGVSNQFPICLTPDEFAKSAKLRLRGMRNDDAQAIEDAQPYANEEFRDYSPLQLKIDHPLAILRELSNTDKHRVLNPTLAAVRNVIWSPLPSTVRDLDLPDGTDSYPGLPDSLTEGSVLMSIVAERTGPDPYLDVDAVVGVEINLGRDAPNKSMVATLNAVLAEVRAIVARFSPPDALRTPET